MDNKQEYIKISEEMVSQLFTNYNAKEKEMYPNIVMIDFEAVLIPTKPFTIRRVSISIFDATSDIANGFMDIESECDGKKESKSFLIRNPKEASQMILDYRNGCVFLNFLCGKTWDKFRKDGVKPKSTLDF